MTRFSFKSPLLGVIVAAFLAVQAQAAVVTAVIESDTIQDSGGTTVNFGGTIDGSSLNVFYSFALNTVDLDATFDPLVAADNISGIITELENYTWTAMTDATGVGDGSSEWWSGADIPITVNFKPIVVILNASSVSNIVSGTEFGLVEGPVAFNPTDAIITGFEKGANAYTINVGTDLTNSIQLITLVPEPSTYALLFGVAGFGFVVYRRRRG